MNTQDPSHPPRNIQILTQDEVEEIVKEDIKQPKQGDDSLPNMLTSLKDDIAHMAKSFSNLSDCLRLRDLYKHLKIIISSETLFRLYVNDSQKSKMNTFQVFSYRLTA